MLGTAFEASVEQSIVNAMATVAAHTAYWLITGSTTPKASKSRRMSRLNPEEGLLRFYKIPLNPINPNPFWAPGGSRKLCGGAAQREVRHGARSTRLWPGVTVW